MLSFGSTHGKKKTVDVHYLNSEIGAHTFTNKAQGEHAAVLKITSTTRSIFYFRGVHSWSSQLIHVVSLHSETAVNIGYSCKMLTDDMTEVFIISGHTVQSVRQELRLVHVSGLRNFHVLTLSVDIFFLHGGGFVFSCHWVMEWIVLNGEKNNKNTRWSHHTVLQRIDGLQRSSDPKCRRCIDSKWTDGYHQWHCAL